MTGHEYAVVDVFADRPLAGNPLAVVMGADDLDSEQMAAIAAEFNLSETTFVTDPTRDGADWRLRSFTPSGDEVAGAGHNALGAWWWLVESGRVQPPNAAQELGGRVLPVRIDIDHDADDAITIGLSQGPAELTGSRVDPQAVLDALGTADPVRPDDTLDLACGSVGSNHLLVALASVADVDAATPDPAALHQVLSSTDAQGCYIYTCSTEDHPVDAYARFFNPTVGIAEDPATGSAAGPLAAHLAASGRAGRSVRILQGHQMGRPSVLRLTVGDGGTTLFGRCALSARGELQV